MTDDQELNERLAKVNDDRVECLKYEARETDVEQPSSVSRGTEKFSHLCQWAKHDSAFVPTGLTVDRIEPGCYEIHESMTVGVYFEKVPVKTGGVINFPHTSMDKVLKEI